MTQSKCKSRSLPAGRKPTLGARLGNAFYQQFCYSNASSSMGCKADSEGDCCLCHEYAAVACAIIEETLRDDGCVVIAHDDLLYGQDCISVPASKA